MTSEKEHITPCLQYENDKGVTAVAACQSICQVNGEHAVDDSTCHHWFRKFWAEKGAVKFMPILDDHQWFLTRINTAITNYPHPTAEELAETFSVFRTTAESRMHALDFITIFYQSVLHHFTARRTSPVFLCFLATVGNSC